MTNDAKTNWRQANKEKVNETNRKWRQANKEKFNASVQSYRKRIAKEMREKGMMFVYISRTQRELKTINYLCKKLKINEDQARRLLIDNEWNVKKILEELS